MRLRGKLVSGTFSIFASFFPYEIYINKSKRLSVCSVLNVKVFSEIVVDYRLFFPYKENVCNLWANRRQAIKLCWLADLLPRMYNISLESPDQSQFEGLLVKRLAIFLWYIMSL